jgi:hypothetical protein
VTKLLLIFVALVFGVPIVRGLAQWERRGKALRAVVILLVLELFESAVYENANLVPRGLFHPGSGTSQFRLPEVVITLALLGRLVAKRPRRIGVTAGLWTAFGGWLLIELFEGFMRGNPHGQVIFEAKAIIYVVGGFALAAGVPIRQYLDARVFERLTRWFAPLMLVLDFMTVSHRTMNVHLPFLPMPAFGIVGSDAASVFGALALITLMIELGKPKKSVWTLIATVPLFVCVPLAPQRAALLGLGAATAFVIVLSLGPVARRRIRVNSCQTLLAALVASAVLLVVILGPATLGQKAPTVPLYSTVQATFSSNGKKESASDRLNELHAARKMIPQHWILGWGLGVEYNYFASGPNIDVTSALTEDIYTDLWVRTGIIGLVIFAAALWASFGEGLRAWRRHTDGMVALVSLAMMGAIITLLIKGIFDSDFENYRLSTTLGLWLGVLRSAATSVDESPPLVLQRSVAAGRETGWVLGRWPADRIR